MPRSFDNLAKPYQRLEHFVFGDLLQRVRAHHLPRLPSNTRTALLLGDGDGRFAQALLQHCPQIQIDSIDISPAMLDIAAHRVANPNQFTPTQADALAHSYPFNHYELIALNFIVDCFAQEQIETLKPKLHAALTPQGSLLYTDFQYARKRSVRLLSQFLIRLLYLAFKATANIRVQSLPTPNWSSHFNAVQSENWLFGTLTSQLWLRKSHPENRPSG